MPSKYSLIGLHLRYRLWIAELNHTIDKIRILHDYLAEDKSQVKDPAVAEGIANFKQRLADARKELDDLRDQMHLTKMKLGADSRTTREIDAATYEHDKHPEMKERQHKFVEGFQTLVDDFCQFQEKYF
jgi:predicted  nucleic acid-binding Zn-ribbon protein